MFLRIAYHMSRKFQRVLTGDRPTGRLHLGHYLGSLKNRVELQGPLEQLIMIADMQALTDNAENPQKVVSNVLEVVSDYLAVGIDPEKSTIFIQSQLPQLSELTMFFLNLITINRLQHNPTIKQELRSKSFEGGVPAGFLCYPVSQAADITLFKADLVPVGADQLPVLEETRWLVRRFNEIYGKVLVEPEPLIPKMGRLPGLDGKEKMSKSLGNAIYLADTREELIQKIKKMHTGQTRTSMQEPGDVEANTVFVYLDLFARDQGAINVLKEHYSTGGVGDGSLKELLIEELDHFLTPIRQKRAEVYADKAELLRILKRGTETASALGQKTIDEVKAAMGLNYFK